MRNTPFWFFVLVAALIILAILWFLGINVRVA